MLISFAVNVKLICAFVFVYAKSRFSHDAAHLCLAVALHLISEKSCIGIISYRNYRKITIWEPRHGHVISKAVYNNFYEGAEVQYRPP